PRPPHSTLFPYTTLFRSDPEHKLLVRQHQHRIGPQVGGVLAQAFGVPGEEPPHVGVEPAAERGPDPLAPRAIFGHMRGVGVLLGDRKSTRLNSSHLGISY